MPIKVVRRKDTGKLTFEGTIEFPDGSRQRIRKRAPTDDPKLAREAAVALEATILRDAWHGKLRDARSEPRSERNKRRLPRRRRRTVIRARAAPRTALDEKSDSPAPANAAPAAQGAPAAPAAAQRPKKKRGPPPVLRDGIIARMRAEISEGTLTVEQLASLDEEALKARYEASRHTVRDARKEALSL